jgi:5'-deoxy-5'-methylthioadenosine phosphorylase
MSIAIIGGSGLDQLSHAENLDHSLEDNLENGLVKSVQAISQITPFGAHSEGVYRFVLKGIEVIFLPRHGDSHQHPPHTINYRANLWLLKSLGVTKIIACNVVGGISEVMSPRTLAVPHQIIDYSWGRQHTFFDGKHSETEFVGKHVEHIDFTQPYSEALRQRVLSFFEHEKIAHINYALYACTQGPRLETAAEVQRLENEGCDIVGMTAMPEAALARELEIDYASIALVVNWAPGIGDKELSMATIMALVDTEMAKVRGFFPDLIKFLALDH